MVLGPANPRSILAELKRDKDGYLTALEDWSEPVAAALAEAEQITLSAAHWEVLWLLRDFYQEFNLAPSMRPLVKYVAQHLGPDKGSSIYLMGLFGSRPAIVANRIAGLPRPNNCF